MAIEAEEPFIGYPRAGMLPLAGIVVREAI